jgi:hypothetical protein
VFQRWGLQRAPSQTPREFAQEAGERLADAAEQPRVRDAALRVIDVFYEVRFGGATLDACRSAAVEEALNHIQRATRQAANGSTAG